MDSPPPGLDPGQSIILAGTMAANLCLQNFKIPFREREIVHPLGPTGARDLAAQLLEGSATQFKDMFRMEQRTFLVLLQWFKTHGGLRDTRHQTAAQKLMFVLWIFAFAEPQRNTAHRFGVTQSSISKAVDLLLVMFEKLHKAFVKQPEEDWLDPKIETDPKNNAFNGCIGAIDGTHIAAHITGQFRRDRWRSARKGKPTQNVFAAVRQDYSFSYVLAGAEGSINDASLAAQAFGRSFRIPDNRFYIADAGFGVRVGLVIPFAGVRYHLDDFKDSSNKPVNAKELYNLRHSRSRVVVEQAFGMLKRRWKIVRIAPFEYSIEKQTSIVYAVTGLHNFLLAQGEKDDYGPGLPAILSAARERARVAVGVRHPDYVRHTISTVLWEEYQGYLAGEGGEGGDSE